MLFTLESEKGSSDLLKFVSYRKMKKHLRTLQYVFFNSFIKTIQKAIKTMILKLFNK